MKLVGLCKEFFLANLFYLYSEIFNMPQFLLMNQTVASYTQK